MDIDGYSDMLNNSVLIYGTEKVLTVLITTNRIQHMTGRRYNIVRSYVSLLVKFAALKIWGQIQPSMLILKVQYTTIQ
jgi:hypothetical protein